MKFFLLLILISYTPRITAKEAVKQSNSKTSLHPKKYVFEHPDILEECAPKKMCESIAPEYCISKKAHYVKCSEQYKDNWIITCECD